MYEHLTLRPQGPDDFIGRPVESRAVNHGALLCEDVRQYADAVVQLFISCGNIGRFRPHFLGMECTP